MERGRRVFELRRSGVSLRKISEHLKREAESKGESTRGFSFSQVRDDFHAVLEVLADDTQDLAREYRTLTTETLEELLTAWLPYSRMQITNRSTENDVRLKMKSGDVIVKAVRELAEIYGVKRPQKVEMSGLDGKAFQVVTAISIEPVASTIPKPEIPAEDAE